MYLQLHVWTSRWLVQLWLLAVLPDLSQSLTHRPTLMYSRGQKWYHQVCLAAST